MDSDMRSRYDEGYSSPQSLPSLTPAKKIYIYRNGDVFYPGKHILVSQRYTRTWNAFLEYLNQTVMPTTGAVQRVHTPVNGHLVDDFSQLRNGCAYVVAGPERFKFMNYNDIRIRNMNPPKSRKKQLVYETIEAKPVVHSNIQADPKVNFITQPKSLWFYRNGDGHSKPLLILLKPRELQTWEQLLRAISDKIVLPNSMAIRRIYLLTGEEIEHVDQLENNQFYVLAGYERFIPTTYGHLLPNLHLASPRHHKPFAKVKYLADLPTPTKEQSFTDQAAKGKAFYEALRTNRTHRHRNGKRIVAIDYDQDESGVFRARKPHPETRGAREIRDEAEDEQGGYERQRQRQRSPSARQVADESYDNDYETAERQQEPERERERSGRERQRSARERSASEQEREREREREREQESNQERSKSQVENNGNKTRTGTANQSRERTVASAAKREKTKDGVGDSEETRNADDRNERRNSETQ